ncbi:MAG TPA: peroxide stress protein YaaA [Pseudonocardiaceae bacterium]
MLVLLPPSETKLAGGDGPPLRLDALSHPELTPVRAALVDELVALAADVPGSRRALGLSAAQDAEIARNAGLCSSPTTPALLRYTGVLYDALSFRTLTPAARARATARLAVGSALFGLLSATDPVPAYRLSAGSALPGGPLAARWRPALEPVLAGFDGLVVDLRSGPYAALARLPGAVTVRVLTEHEDGSRTVVSHHNKAHKGHLARVLAGTRAEPSTVDELVKLLRRNGFRVERRGTELDLVTTGLPGPARLAGAS